MLSALRPALASLDGKLICVSTPYRQVGVLYEAFKRSYGVPGSTLVWKAETSRMNPTVNAATIARALELDPDAGRAEWLAEFRGDVSSFLTPELVDRAIAPGRREIPWQRGVSYVAACDPSGGRVDAMTLAIAHTENGVAVLDCLEVVAAPCNPDLVVAQFATTLKRYGLHTVGGDRYAGSWPESRFRAHGVTYTAHELSTSEFYTASLPLFSSGTIQLLEHEILRRELLGLERRTGRLGRDAIGHRAGGHDDAAAAALAACVLASSSARRDGSWRSRTLRLWSTSPTCRGGDAWMKGRRRFCAG